jgi:hypothetical protein
MKQIIVLAIAVGLGIWVYRRFQASKVATADAKGQSPGAVSLSPAPFNGPDVDPKTGAYLPPSAQAGTVEFSAQGN